eukprot:1998-Heterococcus_DN1.PRE.2
MLTKCSNTVLSACDPAVMMCNHAVQAHLPQCQCAPCAIAPESAPISCYKHAFCHECSKRHC